MSCLHACIFTQCIVKHSEQRVLYAGFLVRGTLSPSLKERSAFIRTDEGFNEETAYQEVGGRQGESSGLGCVTSLCGACLTITNTTIMSESCLREIFTSTTVVSRSIISCPTSGAADSGADAF